jgi:hypothetical protein
MVNKVIIFLCFLSWGLSAWAEGPSSALIEQQTLLVQLTSPNFELKMQAAEKLGVIVKNFRAGQGNGLYPAILDQLKDMLKPERSEAERDGAAWAFGEIRHVDDATLKLLVDCKADALEKKNLGLVTVIMHSLREIAEEPRTGCRSSYELVGKLQLFQN